MRTKSATYARYVLTVLVLVVSIAWVRSIWWSSDALIFKDVASNGADLAMCSSVGLIEVCLAFYHDDYRGKVWYQSSGAGHAVWLPAIDWWDAGGGGIGFAIAVPDWMLIIVLGAWPARHYVRSYREMMRARRLLKLCGGCGYDLRGTIAAHRSECPECGRKFDL